MSDDIRRLKDEVDLVAFMGSRGCEFEAHGQKDVKTCCPFHDDQDPSLIVTPSKGLWHCPVCAEGGSVVDFVMKADGVGLADAVKLLKTETSSASATEKKKKAAAARPTLDPERASALLERAVALYERNFADSADGRDYLESRGLGNVDLDGLRIGCSDGNLSTKIPGNGSLRAELKTLGILNADGSERFAKCLVIPILDAEGEVVTLYARSLDAKAPKTKRHRFLPNRPKSMWIPCPQALKRDVVTIVESPLDALAVMAAGFRNVVALNGTAAKKTDLESLKSCGVRNLAILLDGDAPGRAAALRLLQSAEALGLPCELRNLPNSQDPNAYLQSAGKDALAELITQGFAPNPTKGQCLPLGTPQLLADDLASASQPTSSPAELGPEKNRCDSASESVASPSVKQSKAADTDAKSTSQAKKRGSKGDAVSFGGASGQSPVSLLVTCGPRNYELRGVDKQARKLRATVRVEQAGKLHVDTLDFYSSRARRGLVQDLARVFELPADVIESDVAQLLTACESYDPDAQGDDDEDPVATMTPEARGEAEAFGRSADLIDRILRDFETCGLIGEENNKLLLYAAMTSRLMPEPLSVLVLSSSGAGKTALQDAALKFCPPEDVVKLTSLTGKALFYKEKNSLKHKVLALEEGGGADEANYAIRNLISAGELLIEATVRDPNSGRLTTMENRVEGPTAVFFTHTDPNTDPETKSRFWVTSIDERSAQTREILTFQRQRWTLEGRSESGVHLDAVLNRHRNFQRLLEPLEIVNPYAPYLGFADDRLQSRRNQPKYLNLIAAFAFLRQMQKEIKTFDGPEGPVRYIEVEIEDVVLANRLADAILGSSLDELSYPAQELLTVIETFVKEGIDEEAEPRDFSRMLFTRRDLLDASGWSRSRLHLYVKELVEAEYLVRDNDRPGGLQHYRMIYDGRGQDGKRFVLGLQDPKTIEAKYKKDRGEG